MLASELGYVVVTEYIKANTGEDVSDALQELILNNPHKTIFFPDGEYVLAKPICTPAHPERAVSLQLSTFAIIKAAEGWDSKEALIRLGGIDPYNSIHINGSNYSLIGGVIDGGGIANGVSIDGGRETKIKDVSIKNTHIGLYVKWGANSGSSDADITDVNIVGNDRIGSIGVLIEGHDNTFTNMRIAGVQIGMKITCTSQFLRNIHPLYLFRGELADLDAYRESYAFWDDTPYHTWYNNCYSDQFATGFRMKSGARQIYSDCYSMWYTARGELERGYLADGNFNSVLRHCSVRFHVDAREIAYLTEQSGEGRGVIYDPIVEARPDEDKTYEKYISGNAILPMR